MPPGPPNGVNNTWNAHMWLERFSNNAWDRINYSQSVTSISGYGNKQSATGCVVLNLNAGDQIRTRIQVTRTTNLGMTKRYCFLMLVLD